MHDIMEQVEQVRGAMVRAFGEEPPVWTLVLGSGFGRVTRQLEEVRTLPYGELGLPGCAVGGHAGELVVGRLGRQRVACLSGRLHLYEGHDPNLVVLALRGLIRWGTRRLLTTSSVGSLHADWPAGSLAVLTDHLNLSGHNPLRGANLDAMGPRFPDMVNAYTPALREKALALAADMGLVLHPAVYGAMPGPSFETPAEIRMLRILGADLVGMSVVPETIVAAHAGIENIGFSVVANLGAGMGDQILDHDTITAAMATSVDRLSTLILRLLTEA